MKKGIFQSLLLAVVLAVGFAALWGVFSMWAVEIAAYVTAAERVRENVVILSDGTPAITRSLGGRELEVHDLEGNSILDKKKNAIAIVAFTPFPYDQSAQEKRPLSWADRIHSFSDGQRPATYWYFVRDDKPNGTGWFVGYDSERRVCIGYLGLVGFRKSPLPDEERIPTLGSVICAQATRGSWAHPDERIHGRGLDGTLSPWDVYVVSPGGKIYHADLQRRSLRLVFEEPTLRSAGLTIDHRNKTHGSQTILAVRTDSSVLVLDVNGREVRRYPIPQAFSARTFRFGENTRGEGLFYCFQSADDCIERLDFHFIWVSRDGRSREARTSLKLADPMNLRTMTGVMLPGPALVTGVVACTEPPNLLQQKKAASYPEALVLALGEYRKALLIAQGIAVVFAILCYLRQRRYAVNRVEAIVWPLFVLAFGLPGWIGYRFGRSWPIVESCTDCSARVPRDREVCPTCEVAFPSPALVGTEVFA